MNHVRSKKKTGFTIVELIIAITVLSIAVASTLTLTASMIRMSAKPQIHNLSVDLAAQQYERIKSTRYSAVINEGPTVFTNGFSNYRYQIIVSAVPSTLLDDPTMELMKQVKIYVEYVPTGEKVSLTTLVRKV